MYICDNMLIFLIRLYITFDWMILMLPLIYFEKNQIAPPYHITPCFYFICIFLEMFNILMSVSNYFWI